MKPLGPIPAGFETIDGELAIGGQRASALVDEAGETPLFVYSADMIRARVAQLRSAMPARIGLNYAIKANPFQPVLKLMDGLVDGFDIASAGELAMIEQAGIDAERVSFAGPGKRDTELRAAIAAGVTLNSESEGEVDRALAIGKGLGIRPKIAVRVNPSFELRGSGMKMGGGAKPFGVDEDLVPDLVHKVLSNGAEWRGFHIFTGSQSLDADAICETQRNVLKLAASLADKVGKPVPKLNMGGGFGIPYFHGDTPLDLAEIGDALSAALHDLPPLLKDTQLCLELGRFLVGQSGVYLTRIVDRKESHGHTYLITDGGLHHQLAASGNFGTVIRRNYPLAIASRYAEANAEVASVVGCLCTPLDRLADQAELPKAQIGDIVAVFCAGAYGATSSPAMFLGHGPAGEILV